jgi:hypothetical protein
MIARLKESSEVGFVSDSDDVCEERKFFSLRRLDNLYILITAYINTSNDSSLLLGWISRLASRRASHCSGRRKYIALPG